MIEGYNSPRKLVGTTRLHEPGSTPSVCVYCFDTIGNSLLGEPHLSAIAAIPRVGRRIRRQTGTCRFDAVPGSVGANPVSDYREPSPSSGAEQVVQRRSLCGGGRVLELQGTAKGLGEAEAVDGLVFCPGIDGDGGLAYDQGREVAE